MSNEDIRAAIAAKKKELSELHPIVPDVVDRLIEDLMHLITQLGDNALSQSDKDSYRSAWYILNHDKNKEGGAVHRAYEKTLRANASEKRHEELFLAFRALIKRIESDTLTITWY